MQRGSAHHSFADSALSEGESQPSTRARAACAGQSLTVFCFEADGTISRRFRCNQRHSQYCEVFTSLFPRNRETRDAHVQVKCFAFLIEKVPYQFQKEFITTGNIFPGVSSKWKPSHVFVFLLHTWAHLEAAPAQPRKSEAGREAEEPSGSSRFVTFIC